MVAGSPGASCAQCARYLVVGGGPGGLIAVACLLDTDPVAEIVWADAGSFRGGRLNAYPEVPSNTQVARFLEIFERSPALAAADAAAGGAGATGALRDLPPHATCPLRLAAAMVEDASAGLRRAFPRVLPLTGRVTRLSQAGVAQTPGDPAAGELAAGEPTAGGAAASWTAEIALAAGGAAASWTAEIVLAAGGSTRVCADRVILAVGAQPRAEASLRPAAPGVAAASSSPPPISPKLPTIPLDTALNPSQLRAHLAEHPAHRVAVVGNSHSAVLVLRALSGLNLPATQFYARPARFARLPAPDDPDQRILHDNTGLKGEAAEWASEHLTGGAEGSAEERGLLTRVRLADGGDGGVGRPAAAAAASADGIRQQLAACSHIIYATGYEVSELPEIFVAAADASGGRGAGGRSPASGPGGTRAPLPLTADSTSQLVDAAKTPLPGLYGFGIAFPNRVIDRSGEEELAVGVAKFMTHGKEVAPVWATRCGVAAVGAA